MPPVVPLETADGRRGVVRVARWRDAAAAVAIIREAAGERPRTIATIREEVWTPSEWRRHRLGWGPEGVTLVAEVEGRVVGVLGCARSRARVARHQAELGLTVASRWRGHGVGRAMLGVAERWAREVGVDRLSLRVFWGNERAKRLYESVGYRVEGVERAGARFPEGDVDVILMAKLLS